MNTNFICVTKKELFYTAVMVGIKRLVNVVYEYPIDDKAFSVELNEARKSLIMKKLLHDSAREGMTINFGLCACASFCEDPDSCETIDHDGYQASIYCSLGKYMLMEHRDDDILAMTFFTNRKMLDQYINELTFSQKGDISNGGA